MFGLRRSALNMLGAARNGPLSALDDAKTWLNSVALTAGALRGKVVLVNFWTYSCINSLRPLPYVRAWAEKYKDQGLVVVGVHTPEFGFERELENVRQAVTELRIAYPVPLDSDYRIWDAFNNQAWPAFYFIDAQGRIRLHRFGEGEYPQAETTLQHLLAEKRSGTNRELVTVVGSGIEAPPDWGNLQSPETYVGYGKAENFSSAGAIVREQRHVYEAPTRLGSNHWALSGDWSVGKEAGVSNEAGGRIVFHFHARDLHLVMGPARPGARVRFRVKLDGQPATVGHGVDVDAQGNGVVVEPRLYQLIRQVAPITDREFEIEFLDGGVKAYVFTFG